jgi:hypothetical protein
MRFHVLMTVVLALRCADGIVLGSDSQITDSARGLSCELSCFAVLAAARPRSS